MRAPSEMLSADGGLVVYRTASDIDAIDEYSLRLVAALRDGGLAASYSAAGLPSVAALPPDVRWILLQYNPFSYGRWGVAPSLIHRAIAIRRWTKARLGIMVHEAWVDGISWKSALMGGYQRGQLRALSRIAPALMATTQVVARGLGSGAVHIPVASNITPITSTYEDARKRLAVDGSLVITLFGKDNPSRELEHAAAAIDAIRRAPGAGRVCVFNLGANAPHIQLDPAIPVSRPGELSEQQVSLHLLASDLVLLPFTDGISTRRTTMMAALAHGSPVLAQRGRATDDMLTGIDDVLKLTPVGDRGSFVRAAVDLVVDRSRLRERGAAGRRLYVREFDWPHVARRVMSTMELAAMARRPSSFR